MKYFKETKLFSTIIRLFRFLRNLTKLRIFQKQTFERNMCVWRIGKHLPIYSLCIRWRWSVSFCNSHYPKIVLAWKQIWQQRNSGPKIKILSVIQSHPWKRGKYKYMDETSTSQHCKHAELRANSIQGKTGTISYSKFSLLLSYLKVRV